jgi:hypothetical protein
MEEPKDARKAIARAQLKPIIPPPTITVVVGVITIPPSYSQETNSENQSDQTSSDQNDIVLEIQFGGVIQISREMVGIYFHVGGVFFVGTAAYYELWTTAAIDNIDDK